MKWVLKSLTVGWPPHVVLERVPGDEETLNELFVFLADKRLLLYGYGIAAGITSLDDLANRVDEIRTELLSTLTKLEPHSPIAEWLSKVQDASQDLLTYSYQATSGNKPAADPSDVAPAVDQLRDAFRLVAARVVDVYWLPAAKRLRDKIDKSL